MANPTTPGEVPFVKEKKTRRRQRLSCVECTKRRQKCDRQYPCGLCVSRGVAHLCRWESGPVARPAPARPPVTPHQDTQSELTATIRTLSERIATLERSIVPQSSYDLPVPVPIQTSSSSSTPPTIVSSPSAWSDPSERDRKSSSPSPLEREVHEAAVTLAQLSLAHHGEYVGNGSVVCAIYELGDPARAVIPYSKSTQSTSTSSQYMVSADPVQALARNLPSKQHTDALLSTFFAECNWRCGIPEEWFGFACSNMWRALGGWNSGGEKVNANWLSLLFAVLALAPSNANTLPPGTEAISHEKFFMHAMSARRLAEDALFAAPSFSNGQSAAEGTVLGCIAASLMGTYLADRGRVSEAWKLIGGAIRAAQAAGMHRDPFWDKWEVMCEEERLLRRRGWWSLVIWDRLYSYVLGRPAMIQGKNFDVPLPSQHGSEDPYDVFQTAMVQLSEIVDEVDQKCLCPEKPPYAVVLGIDRRYEEWVAALPAQLQWHSPPQAVGSKVSERKLIRQRHSIAVWYLACRMNVHRPWLMRSTPPTMPSPYVSGPNVAVNPSRERCLSLAMELVRVLSVGREDANVNGATDNNDFGRTFFLFDGAVNIVCALAFSPGNAHEHQGLKLVDRAIDILSEAGADEAKGEISRRAVGVLDVLKRSARVWAVSDEDNKSHGPAPPAQELHMNETKPGATRSSLPDSMPPSFGYGAQMRQSNPTVPFLLPLNFLLSPNPLGSTPSSTPSSSLPNVLSTQFLTSSGPRSSGDSGSVGDPSATNNEDLSRPGDIGVGMGGMNWGIEDMPRPDVQMMLPFEMLQDMPLDDDWRRSSM